MDSGGCDSHGECTSLSDVEVRGNPSGDDTISANITVGISGSPAAHSQLSVQDLQERERDVAARVPADMQRDKSVISPVQTE